MNLAQQQRALLQLINGKPLSDEVDDPYIREIAESPYLELAREVVLWWKAYRIERFCPLTSELLKQLNIFDRVVQEFEPKRINSHYIENIGMAFLSHLKTHASPLISAVSQFEYALIKVKLGDDTDYIIHWKQNPIPVLNSLISSLPIPEDEQQGHYRIQVSRKLPETFKVL